MEMLAMCAFADGTMQEQAYGGTGAGQRLDLREERDEGVLGDACN